MEIPIHIHGHLALNFTHSLPIISYVAPCRMISGANSMANRSELFTAGDDLKYGDEHYGCHILTPRLMWPPSSSACPHVSPATDGMWSSTGNASQAHRTTQLWSAGLRWKPRLTCFQSSFFLSASQIQSMWSKYTQGFQKLISISWEKWEEGVILKI